MDDNSVLHFRKAKEEDVDLIFEWANEKEVRRNSFNTEAIKYEDHCKWFKSKLESDSSEIFIFCLGNQNIGQTRIDYEDIGYRRYRISYMIGKEYRGMGYAGKMLKALEELVGSDCELLAEVKQENIASIKVFEKLGYEKRITDDIVIFTKKI